MVTCRDFHHIWLNEGFATYSEALYWEHFYGRTEYLKDLESKMYFGPGTIYVEDVSNINRVFDTGLSYHKACWVLHILRHVLGDETFFNVLKAYASDSRFKYGTAVTEDFREICETTSGMDLNWFFEQWIYSEYYPVYFYRWEIVEQGNQYLLKLIIEQKQRRTGLFKMPIDITITTEVGDKTYVVWDSLQTQTFEIVMNDKPLNVYLDRDNWILKEIYKPAANRPGFYLDQSYPNPLYLTQSNKAGQSPLATIGYQLYYPGQVSLKIYNTLGQLVVTLVNERQPADFYQVKWNCRNSKGQLVSSGVYVYELVVEGDRATEKMTVMR